MIKEFFQKAILNITKSFRTSPIVTLALELNNEVIKVRSNEELETLALSKDESELFLALGESHLYGLFGPQNTDKALGFWRKAAEKGNIVANHKLGEAYYYGVYGVERNDEIGFQYFLRAAELDEPFLENAKASAIENMFLVGRLYFYGIGTERSDSQAHSWFEKAASAGHVDAMGFLGNFYYWGIGGPQDYAKAFYWLSKAAKSEDVMVLLHLADMNFYGLGTKKDASKAREWWEKAAEKDDAEAMNMIGLLYYHGEGIGQDYAQSISWWNKAAELGNLMAMGSLGHMYHMGFGVEKNILETQKWWERAAEKGNAEAMRVLGHLYHDGIDMEHDFVKARYWWERASILGNTPSMIQLGELSLYSGEPAKAYEYWQEAAEKGDADAMSLLAGLYRSGTGVGKNSAMAARWSDAAEGARKQRRGEPIQPKVVPHLRLVSMEFGEEARKMRTDTLRKTLSERPPFQVFDGGAGKMPEPE